MGQMSPREIALKDQREAKYEREQRRMKAEQGHTIANPAAIAKKKLATKKIGRKRG